MLIENIETLFPENLRSYPLYTKFIELIEDVLSDQISGVTLESDFNDIYYKFRDASQLHQSAIESRAYEDGFSYIVDTVELGVSQIQQLGNFLYLIHLMKGHRQGLEFVYDLFNMDYTLTEWWEKTPVGTPDTFDMIAYFEIESLLNPEGYTLDEIIEIGNSLRSFTQAYVYPIPDEWDMRAVLSVESSVPTFGACCTSGEFVHIEYGESDVVPGIPRWDDSIHHWEEVNWL